MAILWFIYTDKVVSGPFESSEVQRALSAAEIPAGSLIWRRGQREWLAIDSWQDQLAAVANERERRLPLWYLQNQGDQRGPITQTELIEHLAGLKALQSVRLWSPGMAQWCGVYEIYEIMDSLGISRRQTERAPLTGSVRLSLLSDEPRTSILRAASIGAGGLGVIGTHDLSPGDRVSLVIESADLASNLRARGQVQYLAPGNYVGIQFLNPQAELASVIGDYVRRFSAAGAGSRAA